MWCIVRHKCAGDQRMPQLAGPGRLQLGLHPWRPSRASRHACNIGPPSCVSSKLQQAAMADSGRRALAAFAAGAAVGAGALYLYTRASARSAASGDGGAAAAAAAGGGVPPAAAAAGGGAPPAAAHPPAAQIDMARFDEDEILEEQLTRNVQFFGREAQRRICGAFVVVVGLGVSRRRPSSACVRAAGAGPGCRACAWLQLELRITGAAALGPCNADVACLLPAAAGRGLARGAPAAAVGRGPPAADRL